MESEIGLRKTELIEPRKPWHGLADVALATTEWVDWFNDQRPYAAIGDIPPHEHDSVRCRPCRRVGADPVSDSDPRRCRRRYCRAGRRGARRRRR